MKTDPTYKDSVHYFRLFCQRTSIRGIPKIENSKLSTITIFWVIFIFIAHLIMIVLCVLLIERYYRFDTTMKMSNIKVSYRDFPEVTVCSKRFFDRGKSEFPSPFSYLDEYSQKILSRFQILIQNNSSDRAIQMIKNQYTTTSFYHDYFNFIQQRTLSLVNSSENMCHIYNIDGRFSKNKKVICKIKPVYNPLYLNCLAFSIPQSMTMNKTSKFNMQINLFFATKPSGSLTETFKMDEYISDSSDDDGFSDTRVYINTIDDYPFDFEFEAPLNCNNFNHYIVEKSQEQLYFVQSSSATCRNYNYLASSYGVDYVSTRETLCNALLLQRNVWQKCQCFIDSLPNNETSYPSTNLCISNDLYSQCAESVQDATLETITAACLPSCIKTDYSIMFKSKPFYSTVFSEEMETLLYQQDNCKDLNDCINNANCILQKLFQNVTSATCIQNNLLRKKRSVTDNVNSKDSSTTSTAKISENNCEKIDMKLELRPKMRILKESLVVEINTLLSQMGGMCAFITGLTFTFIAEIVETFIFWLNDKIEPKKQ